MRGWRMPSTPITRMRSATQRRDGRSMRVFACILAISRALGGVAEAAPTRVASLNLCTDQLLLLLAAPAQIVPVTPLSHKQAEPPLGQIGSWPCQDRGCVVWVL